MTMIDFDAHQDALQLALEAQQAFARGCALRGVDADESQESFVDAWDHARNAGMVCGRQDLQAPLVLRQLPALMAAFDEGECEGYSQRESELEIALEALGGGCAQAA